MAPLPAANRLQQVHEELLKSLAATHRLGFGHAQTYQGFFVLSILNVVILGAMTTDFRTLWDDPSTPNRERKRLLAYIIEDATLIKLPAEGITKIHVRFKGGKTETLTVPNPKSSAQRIQTQREVVELVDQLLDAHV